MCKHDSIRQQQQGERERDYNNLVILSTLWALSTSKSVKIPLFYCQYNEVRTTKTLKNHNFGAKTR